MRLKIFLILLLTFWGVKLKGETKKESQSNKKILMIIAHKDFRDEELMVPKEYFEQEGWKVTVASTEITEAKGMLGGRIKPDILIDQIDPLSYDALIIVGGVGSKIYWENQKIHEIFQSAHEAGKVIGAICIAPVTLAKAGILKKKRATCWASVSGELKDKGAKYQKKSVVIDGNIVTANGPKAALPFAEKIASLLKSVQNKSQKE